ncbi:single-stranded DNA-binding protein [Candidatus Daviesbacteria bacterium]|nr:single-stranded DNA-binding protein [Candidatus Daviesbacteria bacterium]
MATRSWNRVELIGNLTRDPELRYTPQGTAVVTFSIATNRSYVSDGERREEVDFHRIVAWNKLAELCSQLLKKGNRVFVSGRLQNRSWETQEGQSRQTTEIVIEDMILLTSRNGIVSETVETAEPQVDVKPQKESVRAESEEKTPEKEPEKKEQPGKATEDPGDLEDLPF